jgi:hypothetical protein
MTEKTDNNPVIARADSFAKLVNSNTSDSAVGGVLEGSEGVTQHDLGTLRHVSDKLPMSAWLVVLVEFAER